MVCSLFQGNGVFSLVVVVQHILEFRQEEEKGYLLNSPPAPIFIAFQYQVGVEEGASVQ